MGLWEGKASGGHTRPLQMARQRQLRRLGSVLEMLDAPNRITKILNRIKGEQIPQALSLKDQTQAALINAPKASLTSTAKEPRK